ncbi:hypothetical protein [Mesorhizobium amorphae]|uniref:hypothetical protein n=1 Tax=Mesorhizobium amorphae TaxID=71433 RepID=UPI001FEF3B8B|nr:hypothetical protein [Mesorhizobium amorphae]
MRTIGRFLLLLAALMGPGIGTTGAVTLDSSVAVTDAETLQALERGGLSISRLLGPALGLTRYRGTDASFKDWSCGERLRCAGVHESAIHPGFGTCVSEAGTAVGDPVEFGEIKMSKWGSDQYCRLSPATAKACGIDPARDKKPLVKVAGYGAARQRYDNPEQKTGGFPGGMLRKAHCDKLPDEATCGRLAKTGFNNCIGSGRITNSAPGSSPRPPACAPATRRIPAARTISAPPVMTIWRKQGPARAPASRPISSSSSASTAIRAAGCRTRRTEM